MRPSAPGTARDVGIFSAEPAEARAMSNTDAIIQVPMTGLSGFRLEMGRDRSGIRMQARRSGFVPASVEGL